MIRLPSRYLLIILLALCTSLAFGAEAGKGMVPPAQLQLYNRPVITFHATVLSYTPAERAAAARERVLRAMERSPHGTLSTVTLAEGVMLRLDGQNLFLIAEADANPLAGLSQADVAQGARDALATVMAERLELGSAAQLLALLLKAGAATAAMLLAGWAFLRARRVGMVVLHRWLNHSVATLAAWKRLRISMRAVWRGIRTLERGLGSLVLLFLLYVWASYVLWLFPYTRSWSEQLNHTVFGFLGQIALSMLGALPGLGVVVLIVVLTRFAVRLLHLLLARVENGQVVVPFIDRDTASTTRRLLTVACWLFAIAMIYPYLPGANTEAFKGLSVMVGLMVSLGASSVVGQFAAGLILVYSKSLKHHEYVQIGEVEGTVAEIGLFATKIHTNLREVVSIPNSLLVGQTVKNYSRLASGGGVITTVNVTIGYDAPWRQVQAMLLEAAEATQGVRRDPSPYVYQTALSDYYVEYSLRVAVDDPRRRLEILNELHGHVQDVFNRYGVQIMSPHYMADPDQPKVVPPRDWYPAPAKQP